MEAAGLGLGVLTGLEQFFSYVDRVRKRYQAYSTNNKRIFDVLERLETCRKWLESVQKESVLHPDLEPVLTNNDIQREKTDRASRTLEEIAEKMERLTSKQASNFVLFKYFRALTRANTIEEAEQILEKIEDFTILPCYLNQRMAQLGMCGTKAIMQKVSETWGTMEEREQAPPDRPMTTTCFLPRRLPASGFLPTLQVSLNPAYVFMDFSSRSESGLHLTAEGRLKFSVITGSYGQCRGSFRSTRLVLSGKKGAGKSCCLRGLAQDKDILDRFFHRTDSKEKRGGIFHLQLREGADEENAREQIAQWVEATGGICEAEEVRAQQKFIVCVTRIIEWFSGRNCLFLIDNVSSSTSAGKNIASALKYLSDCSDGSAIVFSSQSPWKDLGECVNIDIPNAQVDQALLTFLRAASLDKSTLQDNESAAAVDHILRICNGRKIALVNAGVFVKDLSRMERNVNPLTSYLSLLDEFKTHNLKDESNTHELLHSMISVRLSLMERQIAPESRLKLPYSPTKLYRSFCVLPGMQCISFEQLSRFWGVPSAEDAGEIARLFKDARLVYILRHAQSKGDADEFQIQIHDLYARYSRLEARKFKELEFWHLKAVASGLDPLTSLD